MSIRDRERLPVSSTPTPPPLDCSPLPNIPSETQHRLSKKNEEREVAIIDEQHLQIQINEKAVPVPAGKEEAQTSFQK